MMHKVNFSLKDKEAEQLMTMVQWGLDDLKGFTPEVDYTGIKESKMALRKLYIGLVNALRRSAVQKDMIERRRRADSNAKRHQEKAGRTTRDKKAQPSIPRSDESDPKRTGRATGKSRQAAKRKNKKA